MERTSAALTVLHIATINKPISVRNGYGPIETVIHNIDRGLHDLGHRSIVACSDDSSVHGEKWPTLARSLGEYCSDRTPFVESQIDRHLANAAARASRGDIDIVHMHEWQDRVHTGRFRSPVPVVMTLHVPAAQSGFAETRAREPGAFAATPPLLHPVAISEFQRLQYQPILAVQDTVHHGINGDDYLYSGSPNPSSYLFHIGRITEDKGQDVAITVARRTGQKLILAGCVQNKEADRAFFRQIEPSIDLAVDLSEQPVTKDYFETVMRPLLRSDKQVIYLGELKAEATKHWYRHARATLFPIRWGEPFGMVLIESMAAGTPVLAFRNGAAPEIVKHGETGFILDSVEEMVAAVGKIEQIDRRACRRHVNANFSTRQMAADYVSVYRAIVDARRAGPTPVRDLIRTQRRPARPAVVA